MFGIFGSSQSASRPPAWTPGTYVLINARSNTAADLSGGDYKTIIGYSLHGGENQQWEFSPCGNGYAIRCMRTPGHIGKPIYMSIEGEARENAFVVATTRRTEWVVEQTHEGLRISWPNSNLVFELGHGVSGPQLMLQTLVLGDLRQLWHFVRTPRPEQEPEQEWAPQITKAAVQAEVPGAQTPVAFSTAEQGRDVETVEETARAVSNPSTVETVTTTESVDYITTTRTTTTTVITTVTEVIRTPKTLLTR
uniref:CAMKK/META protein kinase n=1 Tax=Ganoderma boninense TaxID=34458 RepID=A0A5K1JZP0_9APHY|nr:CAMKK/META protein kinase [Ganoderma boninense]